MSKVMTASVFVAKAKEIAMAYKTSYMLGPWGWPANNTMITRATTSGVHAQANKSWLSYANAIKGKGFLFDCVGLIKGIIWGWSGDLGRVYGGAGYACNGLADIDAGGMIKSCSGVSTNFSGIVPGEVVYMPGHIGIYIGSGIVVESTPKWNWGVQLSTCSNVSKTLVPGTVGSRTWTSHGKLPQIDYSAIPNVKKEELDMTRDELLSVENTGDNPSSWAKESAEKAKRKGLLTGDGKGNYGWQVPLTTERLAVILDRAGVLDALPDR